MTDITECMWLNDDLANTLYIKSCFNKDDNQFNNENIQCTDGNTLNTLTLLSNWHFCKEDDLKYNTYISRDTTVQSRVIDLKGKLLDSLTACL